MTALVGVIIGTVVLTAAIWMTWETRRKMQVHPVEKKPWPFWAGVAGCCALFLIAALAGV
jgi:hypothetical protein